MSPQIIDLGCCFLGTESSSIIAKASESRFLGTESDKLCRILANITGDFEPFIIQIFKLHLARRICVVVVYCIRPLVCDARSGPS